VSYVPNPAFARNYGTRKFTRAGMLDRYRQGTYLERYRAVNLTPDNTVEVRVFRSTRNAAHFRDSVRLVYSSVEYVRSMQPSHKTLPSRELLTWARYVEFVLERYATFYPTVSGMRAAGERTQPRNALGQFTAFPVAG
jgi:hypothetical protein